MQQLLLRGEAALSVKELLKNGVTLSYIRYELLETCENSHALFLVPSSKGCWMA